jgi:RimJ/RimL family protein N-acetyltransferase
MVRDPVLVPVGGPAVVTATGRYPGFQTLDGRYDAWVVGRRMVLEDGLITIREAVASDVPALADLHVRVWNATYPRVRRPPTLEIRESQWRRAFASDDGSWFCFVVEDGTGGLVGFVKGVRYDHPALPDYRGELSKLYLLEPFKGRGIGRRLLGLTVRRFLEMGIGSMLLFTDKRNPSRAFFEHFGAERLLDDAGRFHGGWGWRDLTELAVRCAGD